MTGNRVFRFIRPLFLPRDKHNMEFWLSHGLIIASTILGVYLAASAGYKVAVEFERVKADRDSYYLQASLLSELSDNVDQLERWTEIYATRGYGTFAGRPDEYKLETFVWQAMGTSDATFEVPPAVLTGIRRFYRRCRGNLARMTDKTGATGPNINQMREDVKRVRDEIVPALTQNIERLRLRLKRLEIPPDKV